MGTNYYLVKNKPSIYAGKLIGKASWGWRFLFYEPPDWEHDRPLHTFEQWRDYLKEATESGKYIIMNEYDEAVSYEWLMDLIKNKQKENHEDMFDYCKNVNGYRFSEREFC